MTLLFVVCLMSLLFVAMCTACVACVVDAVCADVLVLLLCVSVISSTVMKISLLFSTNVPYRMVHVVCLRHHSHKDVSHVHNHAEHHRVM